MFFEYREYKECKIKEHNIVWSHDKKLKWNNFIYRKSPEKSLFIDVTFLSRFENTLDNTTSITTYSVFNPKKSIISDTTDTYNLRIAQAKFDLLESHRRKMQKHFDSITLKSSETINDKLFKKIIYKQYDSFELEWNNFLEIRDKLTLKLLEKKIKNELKD